MFIFPVVRALLATTLLLASTTAAAQTVCFNASGPQADLSPTELAAAEQRIRFELTQSGYVMVPANCDQTLYVTHSLIGERIDVMLVLGSRSGSAAANSVEELPAAWSAAVEELTREERVEDRDLKWRGDNYVDVTGYARIGAGGTFGTMGRAVGVATGFGGRLVYRNLGVDAGFVNLNVAEAGFAGDWVRVSALYYTDTLSSGSNGSGFFGGGMGYYGINSETSRERKLHDSGISATVLAGGHFLRQLPVGLFIQAEATLPLFTTQPTSDDPSVDAGGAKWLPTIALTFGVGGAPRPRAAR